IGAVAQKAAERESYECLNGAIRWLMAIETWAHRVFVFVLLADWSRDWGGFQSEYIKLGQTVARALGDVAGTLVEKNETTAAETLTGLDNSQTTAYVQSRLADAMRRHQDDKRANELLTSAQQRLSGNQLFEFSEAYTTLAKGLVMIGRFEDAIKLIVSLKDSVNRNAVRDSIACALVELGDLEKAATLVAAMEKQDFMDLYREGMIIHNAEATIAEVKLNRGDLEEALALVHKIDDPWAITTRDATLEKIGRRLADLAPMEPARVSNLIFDVLRKVRVGERSDVLTYVAALVPVLKASGNSRPLELWSHLKQVHMWSMV
ncbi:MAG: hypothetical protein ND866_00420, partial [Pyrinomonadaceae bacterium]|nr:hypothetical protein [Pyrinomonadaceae bacterium]